MRFDGSKEAVTKSIEHSLEQIGSVGRIAQFGVGRKDLSHDYEDETLTVIDGYVKAGRVDGVSTSEINPDTLRSAAKKFRITALEIEVSLFYPEAITNGLLATCAELDIPVIAYCKYHIELIHFHFAYLTMMLAPLGRGLLGGRIKTIDDLAPDDMKRQWPRYQDGNLEANLKLVEKVEALAKKKGCTPAQVSINWLLALAKRPGMPVIIPIPGSTNPDRIKENATIIDLTDEDLAEIDGMLQGFVMAGDRYPKVHMKDLQL